MGRLNQNSVDSVIIYFKDGRSVEFTDMSEITVSSNYFDFDVDTKYCIEMVNARYIEHTKRTSKRYKKNRRGYK